MRLDDRDIICEQDYSPLSNAELVEAIERYAAIMSNAPLIDFDLEWITGPARALLARAEAAEEERAELRAANEALAELAASETERRVALAERVAELEAALASADDETASASAQAARFWRTNNKLAARVAELEAQVAAQSAQGWRDFTERPPIGEQIQITTVIDAVREEPDGLYRIGNTSEWQAWRPAPQEPTP